MGLEVRCTHTGTEPASGMKCCPSGRGAGGEKQSVGNSVLMDLLGWSKARPACLTSTVHTIKVLVQRTAPSFFAQWQKGDSLSQPRK